MKKYIPKSRVIRAIGLILAAALALELYTHWPSPAIAAPLDIPDDTRYLVLLLHGTGGSDEPILIEVADKFAREIGSEPGVVVRHHVWSPWSDHRLRAGIHGRRIGRMLGEELAEHESLEHIRLIAHSAGSYQLNPLCETYKANTVSPAHIEMTYLDGMGIRGAWDYWYGYRHYGECADYAGTIFSSDDFVVGTNAPIEHAYSIDITQAPSRDDFDGPGHRWPIQYFLDHLDRDEMTPGLRAHDHMPRGTVTKKMVSGAN